MELRDSRVQEYVVLVTISQLCCAQRLLRAGLQLVLRCGKESLGSTTDPVSSWHTYRTQAACVPDHLLETELLPGAARLLGSPRAGGPQAARPLH